jgi:endonuclease YncB( thermonuclease family)
MSDRIYGKTIKVIDGDTLDVEVTRTSSNNKFTYKRKERIRIHGRNAPEIGSAAGKAAAKKLAERFNRRSLRIDVVARDKFGRILGRVTLTPKKK